MPKMHNPDTRDTIDVRGPEVSDRKAEGYVVVGNRPEAEYINASREELLGEEPDGDEAADETEEGTPSA